MSEGPGAGAGLVGLLGGILDSLLGGGANLTPEVANLQKAVRTTWTNLLDVGVFLASQVQAEVDAIRGQIDAIGKALDWLAHTVLSHLKDIVQEVIKLLHHIHDFIAPLVKYLQQLQKEYNALVGQQMRKYLDLIQRIRKVLVPFRLLHLGFAGKLDSYLARFEGDLGAKWAGLIAKQNEVIGVLNDVMDPSRLLRPGHALGAAGVAIGAVHDAVGALDLRALFCLAPISTPTPLVQPFAAYMAGTMLEITTHSGDQASIERARDQFLQSSAIDLGLVQ